jgi:DNA-directed RNA polymerase
MEKSKVKKTTTEKSDSESVPAPVNLTAEEKKKLEKEEKRMRKKVANLLKKQKKQQAMGIVRGRDQAKPWGQEAQVKVCNICIVPMNKESLFFSFCDIVTGCSRSVLV